MFQKIFLRYDEIVRNQQVGFFVGGACKLVETDVGSAVRYFFFQLVLVEGVELFQPFVRIGVHGTEFQEVEYPVITAYTLRLVNDLAFALETDGDGCADEQRRKEYQCACGE